MLLNVDSLAVQVLYSLGVETPSEAAIKEFSGYIRDLSAYLCKLSVGTRIGLRIDDADDAQNFELFEAGKFEKFGV